MKRRCTRYDCGCPYVDTQEVLGFETRFDEHGEVHSSDGPAAVSGGLRMWVRHGLQHREDGPTWEKGQPQVGDTAWALAGWFVPAGAVVDAWLWKYHPGAASEERALLLSLVDLWPYGSSLGELWAVVEAATW